MPIGHLRLCARLLRRTLYDAQGFGGTDNEQLDALEWFRARSMEFGEDGIGWGSVIELLRLSASEIAFVETKIAPALLSHAHNLSSLD